MEPGEDEEAWELPWCRGVRQMDEEVAEGGMVERRERGASAPSCRDI